MMVDKQVVTQRLRALKTYLAELDELAQYSLKELTDDFVKYRAAQHSLQLAAQAIVDIATHIISADYKIQVQDYRHAIEALGETGVISAEFARKIAPLASFRNILVHEYLAVDPARIHHALVHGRDDLREFGRQINAYIQE
jgi:uncharacterized protein YutE (UPF0331/DUF86 family)